MQTRQTAAIIITLLMIIMLLAIGSGSSLAQGNDPTPLPPPATPPGGGPGGGPSPGGGPNAEPPEFDPAYTAVENTYTGSGTVTEGPGELVGDLSLSPECVTQVRFVAAETGLVTAEDGSTWIVPMQMTEDGAGTVDIYNDCSGPGDNPDYLDALDTVVVDEDGAIITGTIFADNYFELYINGEFIGRDTIGFVPFNASAVRFQAAYPLTIAVHLADWETHFGLGMEYDSYNIGDAGFIARFVDADGSVIETGTDWHCLPVYIAPLDDPGCVTEDEDGNPDSSACPAQPLCSQMNADTCRALHFPLPEDWTTADFDSSAWLAATRYAAEEVTNERGYADYVDLFGEAEFIWSQNLDLDNQVLCRVTIEQPGGTSINPSQP